jgi:hypothetical protein
VFFASESPISRLGLPDFVERNEHTPTHAWRNPRRYRIHYEVAARARR